MQNQKKLAFAFLFALSVLSTSCSYQQKGNILKTRYVQKYGITVDKQDWETRGSDGQIITTQKDGVIVTKNFENGVLTGKATYTFPHSYTIAKEESYYNGEIQSLLTHYPSGVPKEKVEWLAEKETCVTHWYHDGTPKSIAIYQDASLVSAQYFNIKNEKEASVEDGQGTRINRDNYGEMLSKDSIIQGKLHSNSTFHPNGDPKTITLYNENAQSHGIRKVFLTGGVPQLFEEWKNGEQTGTTVVFQNGIKYSELPYLNGKREGIEYCYNENDCVVKEISWKNDTQHGPAKIFVENNVKTDWFYEGKLVSKFEFDQHARV